jgi:hypothetical protein
MRGGLEMSMSENGQGGKALDMNETQQRNNDTNQEIKPSNPRPMNLSPDRFAHWKEAIIVLLLLIVVYCLLSKINTSNMSFKKITESDVLAVIASLFVVAVFMERTVEAILSPIRSPDRQKIEHEIEDINHVIESLKPNTPSDAVTQKLVNKKHELDLYNLRTAKRASWLSFGFGLVISFVGVRALSGLIEPTEFKNLDQLNKNLFSFVDVVLTGGVIAGGSAAIDKIGRAISQFYNLKSATDTKQKNEEK